MTTLSDRPVCVIIPAYNAERTIAAAVRSALDQPEVGEVIVVDDASGDRTAEVARAVAPGDDRLRILRQEVNVGPARARNIAIEDSFAPLIAILDADDYFLPGRFTPLLAERDWDIIADNIVFVPESEAEAAWLDRNTPPETARVDAIDMPGFLLGNIPRKRARRGELGFLKPLFSREFLMQNALRYDTALRLGEDFKIYVEMLARGARFRVHHRVGYVARVRDDSLSGRHRAEDLENLLRASQQLCDIASGDRRSARAMRDYLRALRARYLLHEFLETKREDGFAEALRFSLLPPRNFVPIARGVLRDKWMAAFGTASDLTPRRYLLPLD